MTKQQTRKKDKIGKLDDISDDASSLSYIGREQEKKDKKTPVVEAPRDPPLRIAQDRLEEEKSPQVNMPPQID